MAVFTTITETDAQEILRHFSIGPLTSLKPIASGIENTNFFLDTPQGHWVLTVFEKLTPDELPFYLEFCEHLAGKGCRVACPVRTSDGNLFDFVHGKPYSIANRLEGTDVRTMGVAECRSMGRLLAQMHIAARDFHRFQENLRGLSWWQETVPKLRDVVSDEIYTMLTKELAFLETQVTLPAYRRLPVTACHCDLFRNNALIMNAGTDAAEVSGVFDFYFAGCMPWLYDLAVTVNDWCVDEATGHFNPVTLKAFMDAYNAVRPLTADEKAMWRTCLRGAAIRFWISRLYDFYKPRKASLLKPHDPTHFQRVLHNRQTCELYWPSSN